MGGGVLGSGYKWRGVERSGGECLRLSGRELKENEYIKSLVYV